MKFSEDKNSGLLIRSCRPGEINIAGEIWRQSILVHTGKCIAWEIDSVTDLSANHLTGIIAFGPDILLIGTGTEQQFPEIERYAELVLEKYHRRKLIAAANEINELGTAALPEAIRG